MVMMNAWLHEKAASNLTDIQGILLVLKHLNDPDQRLPWGETVRECVESALWGIYTHSLLMMAYVAGDLSLCDRERMEKTFGEPEAMQSYARDMQAVARPGWELPHPDYHALSVPIPFTEEQYEVENGN